MSSANASLPLSQPPSSCPTPPAYQVPEPPSPPSPPSPPPLSSPPSPAISVAPLGTTASEPDPRFTSPGAIFGYVFAGVILAYLCAYLWQLEKTHRSLGGGRKSGESVSSSYRSFPFEPEAGGSAPAAGGGLGNVLERTRGPIWNRVRSMGSQEDLEGRVAEC